MNKKSLDGINEILGFEILDKRSNVIQDHAELFINKIQSLVDEPSERVKNNIRYLVSILNEICWKQNIFPSSLQKINMAQGKQETFNAFTIPVIDVSDADMKQIREIVEVFFTNGPKLIALSLDTDHLDSLDLCLQVARILSSVLKQKYSGPIFIEADNLKFDAAEFEKDREALIEDLKKKTREAIKLGLYNVNYDSSKLIDANGTHISEKMLMNLKMVAMATNLWIRMFQPAGIIVSVSGKMEMVDGSMPGESDFKEYLQRLLKEGSRLRFGVSGDDISKVQIGCPKLDASMIDRMNQLNQVARREFKLGGVVVNAGSIKSEKDLELLSQLKICEIKFKLDKTILNKTNLQDVVKKFGIEKLPFDINQFVMKPNQMPKLLD